MHRLRHADPRAKLIVKIREQLLAGVHLAPNVGR